MKIQMTNLLLFDLSYYVCKVNAAVMFLYHLASTHLDNSCPVPVGSERSEIGTDTQLECGHWSVTECGGILMVKEYEIIRVCPSCDYSFYHHSRV